jgi:hypothetical protein
MYIGVIVVIAGIIYGSIQLNHINTTNTKQQQPQNSAVVNQKNVN